MTDYHYIDKVSGLVTYTPWSWGTWFILAWEQENFESYLLKFAWHEWAILLDQYLKTAKRLLRVWMLLSEQTNITQWNKILHTEFKIDFLLCQKQKKINLFSIGQFKQEPLQIKVSNKREGVGRYEYFVNNVLKFQYFATQSSALSLHPIKQ